MPNRILRDWTDSEVIDQLDVHAERFFVRLIMKVDDFGRYSANAKLLKSHLYPLKTDVRETDITRWLSACQQSGIIALYTVASKEYLQIENFKQVLRQKVEKYPSPDGCVLSATHLHSNCESSASLKGKEVESEVETKRKVFTAPTIEEVINEFSKKLDEFTAQGEAERFFNYYESNGWMVGRNKMKSYPAAITNWILNMKNYGKKTERVDTAKPGSVLSAL